MNRIFSLLCIFAFAITIFSCSTNEAEESEPIPKKTAPNQSMIEDYTPMNPEFLLNGSEEFWSLQVEVGDTSMFRSYDQNLIFTKSEMADSSFTLSNDETIIEISFVKANCVREGRSKSSPYAGSFVLDDRAMNGCGVWKTDPRLLGRWTMSYMKDIALADTLFTKGLPEFVIKPNSIMGVSGCNQFRGGIQSISNTIIMDVARMTKMGCKMMNVEQFLINTLINGTEFKANEQHLELINNNEVHVRFTKASQ